MKKFVVYTAITAGYDRLREPPAAWRKGAEFVAFMEIPPARDTGWDIRPICCEFGDPCRNAKIHKVLAHKYFPHTQYSLWLDGAISIHSRTPLAEWPERYLPGHDLAVFRHCALDCAYLEALWCMRGRLDDPAVIDRQMQEYHDRGYPANHGLAECAVLFRRHTPPIRRFNERWWKEIGRHSRRDQLSFNYVAHTVGIGYAHLPGRLGFKGTAGGNPHFRKHRHTSPHSRPD